MLVGVNESQHVISHIYQRFASKPGSGRHTIWPFTITTTETTGLQRGRDISCCKGSVDYSIQSSMPGNSATTTTAAEPMHGLLSNPQGCEGCREEHLVGVRLLYPNAVVGHNNYVTLHVYLLHMCICLFLEKLIINNNNYNNHCSLSQ